jgi:hypothetical protein
MDATVGDIPGYYYDANKKKYFKVLPNHVGRGSEYSREVVNAKAASQRASAREHEHQERSIQQRLTRSRLLHHPLLTFGRRLDHRSGQVTTEVAEYFCAALTSQRPFQSVRPGGTSGSHDIVQPTHTGPKFEIENDTGAMFTTYVSPTISRCIGRFKRSRAVGRHLWEPRKLEVGASLPLPYEIDLLAIVPSRCVVFSESSTRDTSTIMAVGMGNFSSLTEGDSEMWPADGKLTFFCGCKVVLLQELYSITVIN